MVTSWIRRNFDQDGFQFTWINSDMLCICYSVNRSQVTLLTSDIYKHMKRAATHLFKRQSKNRAFFSKLSNFYFDLRSLPGQISGQDRGAKSRPQGQLECCQSPGVFWWGGGGWSGLELTDTVLMHYA